MNKINFIPYSFIEQNIKRKEKIYKLIFLIIVLLLFFSISTLKSSINRLNNLKNEEKIFIEKVHDIYLKENNAIMEKNIETLWEIIKSADNFYLINLENNTLWIEGMDTSIKGCKKTIINLEEKNNFRVTSLKGPEKKENNYYYKVGVVINGK